MSEYLYRLLLHLYPKSHRREYGEWMAQAFRDQCRAARQRGSFEIAFLWIHTLFDLATNLVVEYYHMLKGHLMTDKNGSLSVWQIVLTVLPAIVLTVIFAVTPVSRNTLDVYLLIAVLAGGDSLLRRLGLRLPGVLWQEMGAGILVGVALLLLLMGVISAPGGGFVLWVALWRYRVRLWRGNASLVAALFASAVLMSGFRLAQYDHAMPDLFFDLSYTLGRAGIMLLAGLAVVRLKRRFGDRAALVLIVAFGVQYVLEDPAYFTVDLSLLINVCVLIFPLAICPIWFLSARHATYRRNGLLLLWGIMQIGLVLLPGIARTYILELSYETNPAQWIVRSMEAFPYFLVLWLVLRLDFTEDRTQVPGTLYPDSQGEAPELPVKYMLGAKS
ncbi:MAG: hypothetical protein K8I60_06050 [Anaerolineae bacterium]|nr:hypothetical protein [Anaerolineae bacterium]